MYVNLDNSKTNFKQILENIPLICLILDKEGSVSFCNHYYSTFSGWKREEFLGRNWFECCVPEVLRQQGKQVYNSMLDGSNKCSVSESEVIIKNGQVRLVSWCSTLVYDNANVVLGATLVGADITEKKQMEIKLKNSEEALVEQNKLLAAKNLALKEIIENIEKEKNTIKKQVYANIQKLVFPLLEKLKHKIAGKNKQDIQIVEENLNNIVSELGMKLQDYKVSLTPRELEISNYIKNGLKGKEIADILNISYQSLQTHRKNIRAKLGLKTKKINLTTYLSNV